MRVGHVWILQERASLPVPLRPRSVATIANIPMGGRWNLALLTILLALAGFAFAPLPSVLLSRLTSMSEGVFAALPPGTIIPEKQTNPNGSSQTFVFDTSNLNPIPGTTTLSDGQTATFPDVDANIYRVAADASVVYTVTATVDRSAFGTPENTANVMTPGFGGTNTADGDTAAAAIGAALADIPISSRVSLTLLTMLLALAGLPLVRRA